ncbi:formate dehydrogenase subunit gamma [Eoetvoesiella caeni]|uniref:Formate dehydrogenase gamma subunit n=1 Tax=Eoetvoesiella caeni TaxID=645616 RepID=A0A366HB07_9BURK|nr:formate dehydrogenase subunit gamma [Eoetvoesiella caeni]MCI2809184.1 formate dehydrogenase subunit gamma [Eoetvoesiella caeni]NYT54326.1 formate dehydrogenase subunit gamma [Eoetvoesiella caeni]RBP39489.1 formate dehydrogenase gamma subunit [Eoetvoesiella caeni]
MSTMPNQSGTQVSDATVLQVTQQAVRHYKGQRGNLLPILHAVQHALGYIPASAVPELAKALQLSRAEIHGVISFYAHFRDQPAGKVVLEICRAESCQAMGGEQLAQHAEQTLGCGFHATTADGRVTLEPVYCLGLCAQSPAIMVNGQPHARMTPSKLDRLLAAQGA